MDIDLYACTVSEYRNNDAIVSNMQANNSASAR